MKRIGIVGSRRRSSANDAVYLLAQFDTLYEKGDVIVSGGCPKGADHFAEHIAESRGIPITIFPADWDKHGKKAGFIRNTTIAMNSDILIALPAMDRTGGTEDTISKMQKMRKPVFIVYWFPSNKRMPPTRGVWLNKDGYTPCPKCRDTNRYWDGSFVRCYSCEFVQRAHPQDRDQ